LKTDKTLNRYQKNFQNWATSYYGTSTNKIEEILQNRFISFPGERLPDGTIFSSDLPDEENDLYTSPSIEYISELHSHLRTRFVSHDRNTYEVQLVLQCKQTPRMFTTKPGESAWCNIIPDDNIVWKSTRRSTIVPSGLMVRARIYR
jgi:hypothetical protein